MISHASFIGKQPIWLVSFQQITTLYNLKVGTGEFAIKDDYLQFNEHLEKKT